ncbi:hypothetical protein Z043_108517 [Scleropages formosus]|uniref:Myosin motor domain-containing protein n=1 Tax=Scleropages formosus TaxID=113540 RepID=A0A0P7VGA1_SCLFO|nr:hypothetical protein Z043_108517 [Scleropages formosus]
MHMRKRQASTQRSPASPAHQPLSSPEAKPVPWLALRKAWRGRGRCNKSVLTSATLGLRGSLTGQEGVNRGTLGSGVSERTVLAVHSTPSPVLRGPSVLPLSAASVKITGPPAGAKSALTQPFIQPSIFLLSTCARVTLVVVGLIQDLHGVDMAGMLCMKLPYCEEHADPPGLMVKEETKAPPKSSKESSDSDGSMSSRSQSAPSLEPGKALLRTKSPDSTQWPPQQGRLKSPSPPRGRTSFRSPEPPVLNGDSKSNGLGQASPAEDRGSGPKRVVKVVRRVVRKVLPSEDGEATLTPPGPEQAANKPIPEPPKTSSAPSMEEKDDITAGLASLMVRGRSREHKPRSRKEEPSDMHEDKEERKDGMEIFKSTEESIENGPAAPHTEEKNSSNSSPVVVSPPPKSSSLTPPPGFIPTPKPSALSPPPGFIPAPKPTTAAPPKSNPLSPPSGFVPPLKSKPFSPPPGFIPPPKPSPLSPPPGFIPAPKPMAVKKLEVAQLTPTEEAQRRLERIFTSSVEPAAAGPTAPAQVLCSSLEDTSQADWPPAALAGGLIAGQVDEDPVGVLQAAHTAAAQPKVKTEEQIAAEQAWYGSEKVWLAHKDGFSLATLLKTETGALPEGKVKIKLEHDGTVLDVDEDDVEKANPPSFDRAEDLASLLYLNESSVIHTLRQRYGGNLIHTHAGPSMVVVNPVSTPSMYSEKVMHMFKGCRREDTAPHIYAVAQTAYRNLLTTRQDQSIVLLGKSGSGKTTNCQHLVQYLVSIAGSTGKIFSAEKWQAVYTILEAFGNSSTSMNANASRFSQIVSLDFDQAGQVASASFQTMLLEKLRVSRRPEGESTFHVFYYLMAGAESTLRTELHFNHFAENSAFGIVPLSKVMPGTRPPCDFSVARGSEVQAASLNRFTVLCPQPEDKQKASQQFTKLQAAMKVLGISAEEQKALWLVLGAIYHLGAAGATKAGRRQFARHEWAQKGAYLLGCTLEEISSAIFKHQAKGALQRSTSFRQGPDDPTSGDSSGPKITALECLEAMASSLYSELFTLLISLVNRALKSSQHSLCSLLIVDTPGFQNPRLAKRERGATFEELCHNYAQERLQTLFHERTFVQELERYKEDFDDFIFAFFAVEMVIKMVALGIFGKKCYLGDTWNRLDFFIVLAGGPSQGKVAANKRKA